MKLNNNGSGSVNGGISIMGLLGLIFIVLKLVGVITWSWVWVLAPFWIPVAFFVVLFLIWLIA
jgi:hypothetical protein